MSTFTHALSTNNYGPAKFIVSASPANGTHTTISSAIASASSGDTIFIRNGTYTENITLKSGVNLTSYDSEGVDLASSGLNITSNVKIVGRASFTTAGSVCMSGITIQTNSDYALAVTGSAASNVGLTNCSLLGVNNNIILFSSSSSSANIFIQYSNTGISDATKNLYDMTSPGSLSFYYCSNGAAGTVASNNSTGVLTMEYVNGNTVMTTSGNGIVSLIHCDLDATNTTILTTSGSGTSTLRLSSLVSGSSPAISVGASTRVNFTNGSIESSATNTITGLGTIAYGDIVFLNSSGINTTTQIPLVSRSLTNIRSQVFTGSGTYTPTAGMIQCYIKCLAGGSGGGGAAATGASTVSVGSGGGSGEYAEGLFSSATIGVSQVITIGAGGVANSGAAGGAGGNSSVGALITCIGGTGGLTPAAAAITNQSGSLGGTGGTGGTVRTPGQAGQAGLGSLTPGILIAGSGGNSQFGSGGISQAVGNASGANGLGFGAGGSGASNFTSQSARSGGTGSGGIIIITEYVYS